MSPSKATMPKIAQRSQSCRYNPLNAANPRPAIRRSTSEGSSVLKELDEWLASNSLDNVPQELSSQEERLLESYAQDPHDIEDDTSQATNSTIPSEISIVDESKKDTPNPDLFHGCVRVGHNKLNRFILTIFPPTTDAKWLDPKTYWPNASQLLNMWVGQFELAPTTNKLHAHIYIEFHRRHRLSFTNVNRCFRKYFEGVQIRPAKRSSAKQAQCAINYVMDDRKRAPQTDVFVWDGCVREPVFCKVTAAANVEKEDESEQQRLYIESKPRYLTWDQIVHECEASKKLLYNCSWGEKYHKGRSAEIKRRTITNVIIMYGAGGTGKTTTAMAFDPQQDEDPQERYYRRNPDDGLFWGGGRTAYKGQRIIHYEEFTGQETFSRLKEVCDIGKPGPPVNVKNGGGELNHDTVIITSNVHPAGWFSKLWAQDPKQFHPFWRRVTQVRFYPSHRADGQLNIPSEENPPYFVDQTADWKQLAGCYANAKRHADNHWPIREESAFADGFVLPDAQRETNPFYEYCKTGNTLF